MAADSNIFGLPNLPAEATLNKCWEVIFWENGKEGSYRRPALSAKDFSNLVRGGTKLVSYLDSRYPGVPAGATALNTVAADTLALGNEAWVMNPSTAPATTTLEPAKFVLLPYPTGTAIPANALKAYADADPSTTAQVAARWVPAGGSGSGLTAAQAATVDTYGSPVIGSSAAGIKGYPTLNAAASAGCYGVFLPADITLTKSIGSIFLRVYSYGATIHLADGVKLGVVAGSSFHNTHVAADGPTRTGSFEFVGSTTSLRPVEGIQFFNSLVDKAKGTGSGLAVCLRGATIMDSLSSSNALDCYLFDLSTEPDTNAGVTVTDYRFDTSGPTPSGVTAAQLEAVRSTVQQSAPITANYTLKLADAGNLIQVPAAAVITIPTQASVAWQGSVVIELLPTTAAMPSVVVASGVTLLAATGNVAAGMGQPLRLIRIGPDFWNLTGGA